MLNVSRVVLNPMLLQSVQRTQRAEVINTYGESVLTPTVTTIQAIVTNPSMQDLIRFPEATAYKDAIIVSTASSLTPDTVGSQPDMILWRGSNYIVAFTNDNSSYGYTRAICKLVDLQA